MYLLPDLLVRLFCSHELFLLSLNHYLLAGYVFSKLDGISVELLFLLLLLLGAIFSVSDHVLHFEDLIGLFQVVVLDADFPLFESLVAMLDGLKSFFLFLFDLSLFLVFLHKVSKNLVLL